MNRYKILNCLQNDQNVINQLYVYAMNMKKIVCCISAGLLQDVSVAPFELIKHLYR